MSKIPKSVSSYMSGLALKAAAKMRGTEAAKIRSQKARAAKARKREERLALLAAAGKTETPALKSLAMAETIDLSYLSKFPGGELLSRLYARNGMSIRSREGETFLNEFSLNFRWTPLAGNSPSEAEFSFGRRILFGTEVAGITFSDFLSFDKGSFGSLRGLQIIVDYRRGRGKEKKFEESYHLNEIPARLTPELLGFRVSKAIFARIEEAYQELISELSMPVEHDDLHTDTSDRDL